MNEILPQGNLGSRYVGAAEMMLALSIDQDRLLDSVGATALSGARFVLTGQKAVSAARGLIKNVIGELTEGSAIQSINEHFDHVGAGTRNSIAFEYRTFLGKV